MEDRQHRLVEPHQGVRVRETSPLVLPAISAGRGTVRRSRMVEGHSCTSLRDDQANHSFKIIQHIVRGNAQRPYAGIPQDFIARQIALRPIAPFMRFAIDFDRKAGFAAKKVQHKRPDRVLSTKFEPLRPLSQHAPQKHFRQAHIAPKIAGAINRADLPSAHRTSPSTMLRMVPLPETLSGRILQTRS